MKEAHRSGPCHRHCPDGAEAALEVAGRPVELRPSARRQKDHLKISTIEAEEGKGLMKLFTYNVLFQLTPETLVSHGRFHLHWSIVLWLRP